MLAGVALLRANWFFVSTSSMVRTRQFHFVPLFKSYRSSNEPVDISFTIPKEHFDKIQLLLDALNEQQRTQLIQYCKIQYPSHVKVNIFHDYVRILVIFPSEILADFLIPKIMQIQQGTCEYVEPSVVNDAVAAYFAERAKEWSKWFEKKSFADKMAIWSPNSKYGECLLAEMPVELLVYCFTYLRVPTLMQLCVVCKEWYKVVTFRYGNAHYKPLIQVLDLYELDSDVREVAQQVCVTRCGHTITEIQDPVFYEDSNTCIWFVYVHPTLSLGNYFLFSKI